MKIAVISDIHGNLPALEAVMADIQMRGADKIICLGDIIGKGPSSREAVDICADKCAVLLIGNWEAFLYKDYMVLKSGQAGDISERARWFINEVGSERMEYLASLPHFYEFYLSGRLVRLFHAHPQSFARYFEDSPLENRLELFNPADNSIIKDEADIAIYADIHTAYMQEHGDKLLLNTGSVGNPLDMTLASYVMLEGSEGSSQGSGFDISFHRVEYDIARTVSMAKNSGVPDLDGYIMEITAAKYFRRGNV